MRPLARLAAALGRSGSAEALPGHPDPRGACALIVAIGPLAMTLSRTEYEASSSIAQSVDLPGYTPAEEVAASS